MNPALPSMAAIAAVVMLAAACSSGGKKTANNAAATPITAPGTAAPIFGARSVPAQTPASLSRTATPSTALRTATPTAAQTARGATPGAAASPDTALQQALASAALKENDLPAGYTTAGRPDTSTPLAGETASYVSTFVKLSLTDLGLVVDGLLGFKDSAAAQAALKDAVSQLQGAASQANLQLTPTGTSIKLGDETQAYSISVSQAGFTFTGYGLVWRRGRISAAVALAGAGGSAPQSVNDVLPLAQKQDDRLRGVQQ